MEVYLIRHTTPAITKGICYGQSDIDLADCFQKELHNVASLLPEKISAIYSSPLIRCQRLAKALFPKETIVCDNRLMELNFGDWEMKDWSSIDENELNSWMQDFVNTRPTNGENLLEMNERVKSFISEIQNMEHDRIGIITHAGVIRSFISNVLDMPLSNIFKINIDYGSVSKMRMEKEYKIVDYINKT